MRWFLVRLFVLLPVLLTLAGAGRVAAQAAPDAAARHLVYFRDKAGSPYSLSRPQEFLSARSLARRSRQGLAVRARDLPVSPAYLARVRAVAGAPAVRYSSRWLNAALIACDSATLARVLALPEVGGARTLSAAPRRGERNVLKADKRGLGSVAAPAAVLAPAARRAASRGPRGTGFRRQTRGLRAAGGEEPGTRASIGKPFGQNQLIGAVQMHDAGFRGEEMQIAVFDAGFLGVNTRAAFQSLQAPGRLAGTRNFVEGGRDVFRRDAHGTNCLSVLGAEVPGFFVGTAPRATYYLCLTEDVDSERPVEEANWLAAAEYADSAGVDVISSSLGYNTFDAPAPSYAYADLNGRTALSSRAALEAARVGMLVVSSAGNEGNKPWRYITAPADADSILSVGAVDSLGRRAAFSSVGPTADGRRQPTLAAQGVATAVLTAGGGATRGNGTSFSCPALAGLAAGFWQANPQLTAQQVIYYLTRSASQAAAPDNLLGYGIPNFRAAQALVPPLAERLELYPNPVDDGQIIRLRLPRILLGQALQVRVLDARGALVRELVLPEAAGDVRELPLAGLSGGSYFCQVAPASGQPQTVRFVVR